MKQIDRYCYEEETRDFVAHGFSIYDSAMLAETEAEHATLMAAYARLNELSPHSLVVDVGCGVGGLLALFQETYPELTYVGATNSMLQLHHLRARAIPSLFADMDDLVLPHADRFVFQQSIGHAKSLRSVLEECARKLKPGGAVVIKDFDADTISVAESWAYRAYPRDEFVRIAESCGLNPVRVEILKTSGRRYFNYWNTSAFMRERHGQPHQIPCRSCLYVFEGSPSC